MSFWGWFFGEEKPKEKVRKKIFISFAIEDIAYRDHLVKQSTNKRTPFDFIDMSVKEEWNQKEWKNKCRILIKSCDGVIALLSKNTHKAGGARWEMKCADEENVKIVGMHIYKKKKGAIPRELDEKEVMEWSWENLEKFINKL